uniref:Uncharacterized protein n=1 Tax=Glossina austeni TaxID=7395 RepID=A0A1A9UK40_GLOAU
MDLEENINASKREVCLKLCLSKGTVSVKSPKMLQNTYGSDILQINGIKHLMWAANSYCVPRYLRYYLDQISVLLKTGLNALTTKVLADNCKKRQICSHWFMDSLYAGQQYIYPKCTQVDVYGSYRLIRFRIN